MFRSLRLSLWSHRKQGVSKDDAQCLVALERRQPAYSFAGSISFRVDANDGHSFRVGWLIQVRFQQTVALHTSILTYDVGLGSGRFGPMVQYTRTRRSCISQPIFTFLPGILSMLMFLRIIRTILLSAVAALSLGSQAFAAPNTVVLVHGAFADGSSWRKVIPMLEKNGIRVVAVQLPLTSLADDVAATKRAIDRIDGPITLVGHSWGGTVITEAGNVDKVKSLVYVAALANPPGTSYQDLVKPYPPAPGGAAVQVDSAGFATLSADGVMKDFAPDLKPAEQALVLATQGPIRGANFGEKTSTTAAWTSKASWFVVARNDRMIPVQLEMKMASDIHAQTTVVDSSHVIMLAHPQAVAAVIEAAAAHH